MANMEEMNTNRRKFIKGAVAGAAGLVVTSALLRETRQEPPRRAFAFR
jgi:hypothetical protein